MPVMSHMSGVEFIFHFFILFHAAWPHPFESQLLIAKCFDP